MRIVCMLVGHKWHHEHVEDSEYLRCERCGAERAPNVYRSRAG